MKRLLVLITVLLCSLTLAACGGEETGGQQLKPGATVITYCSWNLGTEEEMNIYRRQIYKFNEERDDVQIKIVDPEGDYDTFLSTMASARQLPDVFMVNSVPKAVINYLAKDITALAAADDEWSTVDPSLIESVTYHNRLYGIPCGQYYAGYFANMNLLEKAVEEGQDPTEVFAPGAFTTAQFITAVQSLRNINVKEAGSGWIGLDTTGDMINWLPSTLDETGKIKYFVWNTEKLEFELTSDIMYDSIREINKLSDKNAAYTFQNVENKEEVFGPGNENAVFMAGKMAFRQSGTWEKFQDSRVLDVEFVGYPGGNVISISDYMCISRATKNPELAFEVAKYLSYGVKGTMDKFAIVEEANDPETVAITGLPVVNNEEIIEKWFDYITLDGVLEVYEKVAAGEMTLLVEGKSSIPGLEEARFDATTGLAYEEVNGGATLNMSEFIWATCSGSISIDTYISDMNSTLAAQINKGIKDAYAQIAVVASKEK